MSCAPTSLEDRGHKHVLGKGKWKALNSRKEKDVKKVFLKIANFLKSKCKEFTKNASSGIN